jgi:hypothetical protein
MRSRYPHSARNECKLVADGQVRKGTRISRAIRFNIDYMVLQLTVDTSLWKSAFSCSRKRRQLLSANKYRRVTSLQKNETKMRKLKYVTRLEELVPSSNYAGWYTKMFLGRGVRSVVWNILKSLFNFRSYRWSRKK